MEATFVYDGDCAFCSSSVRIAQRWIPTGATVIAWQFADLARLGLTEAQCDQAVQWVVRGQPTLAGPEAFAAWLRSSRWGWRMVGRVLGSRPGRAIGWPVYRWVSRHRHQLPGGTAACAVPQAHR